MPPAMELLMAVLGSMCGSGGVVWLIVRAAVAELETKFEKRLLEERDWQDKTYVRRHA